MSEYLSKKAVLEWLESEMSINKGHPDDIDIHWTLNRVSKKILSGAFDSDNTEIQRLRAALSHIHVITQSELDELQYESQRKTWEEILLTAEEALSATTEPTGQNDADDLLGDWIDERCPKCGAYLLANKVGDKWCSLVGCDYSINAPY